jgi:hypothetical protein
MRYVGTISLAYSIWPKHAMCRFVYMQCSTALGMSVISDPWPEQLRACERGQYCKEGTLKWR